jgi:proton-translocating NADH-quinone oxidoreductase chain N
MLFIFLCIILLAIGIRPHFLHPAISRLGAVGLLCSVPLVVILPEGSVSLYSGLVSWDTSCSVLSLVMMFIGASLLISNNYNFAKDSYALFGVSSLLGARFVRSSNDLITLFLGIELQSFGVYLLASSDTRSLSSTGAALKYFLLGALSTALILLGSTSQYLFSGTTSLEGVVWSESSLILIISGLLFKIAAAPFHSWAPDVYDGVRSEVSAWLQALPKVSVVVFLTMKLNAIDERYVILLISAVISLVIGTVLGIKQSRVRRLLAYSTISHVGFLLLGACSNEAVTLRYIMSYAITTMSALLCVSVLSPTGTIKSLVGVGHKFPCLSLSFAVALLSLAGIPPLFGFFAKANVLQAARNPLHSEVGVVTRVLAIVGILCSVISGWYYLSLIAQRFFSSIKERPEVKVGNSLAYVVSTGICLLVIYPILNSLILNVCSLAALST